MINNLPIYKYDLLPSANIKAKELAAAGAPHGTVVMAGEQSAGRGRMGRKFYSPPGCGVYMSMVIRPEAIGLEPESAVLLTTAASVAVVRAVSRITGKELSIKWVNDLYYGGKKVCGILAEGMIDPLAGRFDGIILGIGLNVLEPENGFPEDIRYIAGALFSGDEAVEADALKSDLVKVIAEELINLLPQIGDRAFLEEYEQRSMVIGRTVRVFAGGAEENSGRLATAVGIDRSGGLVVQYCDDSSGGVYVLNTGEISIRTME